MIKSALIFVCMDIVEGVVGFPFHLLSFEFVIFVDPFSYIFKSFIFSSLVQNNGFSLSLHLLGEKFIFLLLELFMHLFLSSLLLLLFKNLVSLVLGHSFPMVGLDSVPVEFRLACLLYKME